MLFLIRNYADSPSADARVAAKQRLAVFSSVFLEFAGVHDARNDFAHVVLLDRVAGKNSVDFVTGEERVSWFYMAEWRGIGCAHLVCERSNTLEACVVIRFAKIHRAADLRMHLRPAQFFRGGFLAD